VPSGFGEGDGGVETEAGGGAGDDGEFAGADFDASEELGGFFAFVDFIGEF